MGSRFFRLAGAVIVTLLIGGCAGNGGYDGDGGMGGYYRMSQADIRLG